MFPSAPLFAAGYSLGGLMLTKYLAEADRGMHGDYSYGASGTGGGGGNGGTSAVPPVVPPLQYEGSGLTAAAVVSSPVCMHSSAANLLVPWTFSYLYKCVKGGVVRGVRVLRRGELRGDAAAITLVSDPQLGDLSCPLSPSITSPVPLRD